MATDKGYQGWANWETWCVHLWLSNEQGSHEQCVEWGREVAEEASEQGREAEAYALGQRIRDWLEELAGEQVAGGSLWLDLVTGGLSDVDWDEIGEAYLPERGSEGGQSDA